MKKYKKDHTLCILKYTMISTNMYTEFFEITNSIFRRRILTILGLSGTGLRFQELMNLVNIQLEEETDRELSKEAFNQQIRLLKQNNLIEKVGSKHTDPFRLTNKGQHFFKIISELKDTLGGKKKPYIIFTHLLNTEIKKELVNIIPDLLYKRGFRIIDSGDSKKLLLDNDKKIPIELDNDVEINFKPYE